MAPSALSLAAVVATVCMAGSLYFSEVAHFPPCHLCWLQRYCMYPLVPILWFTVPWRLTPPSRGTPPIPRGSRRPGPPLRRRPGADRRLHQPPTTWPLERNPEWESSVCDPKNPCTLIWVKRLGYLTIPTMALSGFALIITLLAVSRAGDRKRRPT